MHEWIVVGGGVHGTVFSLALTTRGGVDRNRIAVIDPHDRPLSEWRRNTRSCGMRFLRSPGSHSLDPDFTGLRRWAVREGVDPNEFFAPYFRPSLRVFEKHSDRIIDAHNLSELRLVDRVVDILPAARGALQIVCESGCRLYTRRVVLAVGRGDGLNYPRWARVDDDRLRHVFGPPHTPVCRWAGGRVMVVGGGISAGQVALSCAGSPLVESVTLLSPHEVRVSLFDSEPCYIGPKCLPKFLALGSPQEKRELLAEARHPGSMPPYLSDELDRADASGRLARRVAAVRAATFGEEIVLHLEGGGRVSGDCVILATGFESEVPQASLVRRIADRFSLRTDDLGFPVPGVDLRWQGSDYGLYVSGILGELSLGPSAANIIGAQTAARRLVAGYRTVGDLPWTWSQATAS